FNMISEIVRANENGRATFPIANTDVWKNTDIFQNMSDEWKDLFSYIMRKTVSGKRLQDIFYLIVTTYDSTYVETIYKLYSEQNKKVYAGNYDIQNVQVDENFKELFVNYFYNTFFADDY